MTAAYDGFLEQERARYMDRESRPDPETSPAPLACADCACDESALEDHTYEECGACGPVCAPCLRDHFRRHERAGRDLARITRVMLALIEGHYRQAHEWDAPALATLFGDLHRAIREVDPDLYH